MAFPQPAVSGGAGLSLLVGLGWLGAVLAYPLSRVPQPGLGGTVCVCLAVVAVVGRVFCLESCFVRCSRSIAGIHLMLFG